MVPGQVSCAEKHYLGINLSSILNGIFGIEFRNKFQPYLQCCVDTDPSFQVNPDPDPVF